MRVVFMGTPEFSVPSLEILNNSSYDICTVVTQPDRPSGRGQKQQPSPVKVCAEKSGIRLYQPEKIRSEKNRPIMQDLRPDFLVVVAYGQILPQWLLDLPKIAPVNVHASLLPRHRGAAPVAWSILKGDTVTGVTTMLMEATLDTGAMLLKKEVPLTRDMSGGDLESVLSHTGAELLIPTLDGLRDQKLKSIPQDEDNATLAPRITKDLSPISWDRDAGEVHNRIRAFNPWPVASTDFRGQRLQIFRSRLRAPVSSPTDSSPGRLLSITEDGIVVQCGGSSTLELLDVQLPGKKKISGKQFANGARLQPGNQLF